jgi:hypothetical protein
MNRVILALLLTLFACGTQPAPCVDSSKPCKCSCTGGALATGGSNSTGGAIGGSNSTGGQAATGGSSSAPTTVVVNFPPCENPTAHASKPAHHKHHKLGSHATKPRTVVRATIVTGASVFWPSNCAALDQGDVGSCTGNDATQISSTPPYSRACTQADETAALACYSAATKIDKGCAWNATNCAGSYPPTDKGSFATSAMQAATDLGWFKGTRSVTQTLQGWHDALLLGPCGFDQNWYNNGFTPTACGEVAITGGLAGGHSTEAVGFDVQAQRLWLRNSWGDWGVADGYFWNAGATMVCPEVP